MNSYSPSSTSPSSTPFTRENTFKCYCFFRCYFLELVHESAKTTKASNSLIIVKCYLKKSSFNVRYNSDANYLIIL